MNTTKTIKLYLSILFAFVTINTHAQLKVTPEVGMNITFPSLSYDVAQETLSPLMGMRMGVGLRYGFNKSNDGFALQSGLYYTQHKNEGSITILGENTDVAPLYHEIKRIHSSDRRDYLQVPLMAQYAWFLNEDIRYHISAGSFLSYGFVGKGTTTETDWTYFEDGTATYDNNESHYDTFDRASLQHRRLNTGVMLQTGIEVSKIAILVNYYNNLNKSSSADIEHNLSVGIGYSF